ncbi:MAG: bifunctional riboflavin kinase/FAD synthetase [Gammaproteobacteria bacterium]|nr:bifunctional riboflavin kinase/FAD synthetase [Gammaproteobacteria bacterium]
MQLIRDLHNLKELISGSVVTIGNFDGVHLGHQEILSRLKEQAAQLKLPACVIIFEPQPQEYFSQTKQFLRLTSLPEKLALFQQHGIDFVLVLRFTLSLAKMSAAEFVKTILFEKLHCVYLIIGDDFVFGKNATGDLAFLRGFGAEGNFKVEALPELKINNVRVSSTMIRDALEAGDLATVRQCLGRPYSIFGRVVHGQQLGQSLGFPTANVYLVHKVVPLSGVYVVNIKIDNRLWHGVANVGFRPTVGTNYRLLEVYIFDFAENIYGKKIQVEFLFKLRDEKKFTSFAELKQRIADDVTLARKFFLTSNL